MLDDFKALLSVFNAHSVKYLVVDGYAVSYYAQPRATKDLDLFIKADPANARETYAALASFGAPLSNITVDDLADARKFIRFGSEPVAVDLLPAIARKLSQVVRIEGETVRLTNVLTRDVATRIGSRVTLDK